MKKKLYVMKIFEMNKPPNYGTFYKRHLALHSHLRVCRVSALICRGWGISGCAIACTEVHESVKKGNSYHVLRWKGVWWNSVWKVLLEAVTLSVSNGQYVTSSVMHAS